jgi:hypothetical protein
VQTDKDIETASFVVSAVFGSCERNALAYLAGWIAFKLKSKVSCDDCVRWLVSSLVNKHLRLKAKPKAKYLSLKAKYKHKYLSLKAKYKHKYPTYKAKHKHKYPACKAKPKSKHSKSKAKNFYSSTKFILHGQ